MKMENQMKMKENENENLKKEIDKIHQENNE